MIVDLHKYLIFGNRSEMDHFFETAQKAGFMEFIGLSHKKALEMPDPAKTILSAIKIARGHSATPDPTYKSDLSPLQLAESVVHLQAEHEKLLETKRMLKMEMARVAPFGNFSRPKLDELERESKRVFQFFVLKNDFAKEMELPDELIYIGTEYDLAYFVAINKERKNYPKMIEVIIDQPIGELKNRFKEVKTELMATEVEIHNSAKALPFLQEGLCDYLNEYHLELAKHDAASPLGDALFAIEAWVPETNVKALQSLLSNLDVVAEEIAIGPNDRIPTCMDNHGMARLGEDLVQVYDTPAATDKDPSLWVIIFFSFFFAMIIADAGYGLIYLSLILYAKYKIKNPAPTLRRFLKLGTIVASACIVWGALTVSFFGMEVGPDNPLRKVSFLHGLAVKKAEYHMREKDSTYEEYVKLYPETATATDGHDFLMKASKEVEGQTHYYAMTDFYDTELMELSLFIGLIHIILSFIRYLDRNWTGIGWVCFMVGGYLYFPYFVDATSFVNYLIGIPKETAYAVGKHLLYTGLGLVLVLSFIQKRSIGAALHELMNSIQIFGDVLSYLRLYALALAGMMMAMTFNDLGVQIGFFGIFVIMIGHLVNLSLAIMSGTIHGLRLNFLEWYHYCFEGGGKVFNPLRIRKVK